MAVVRDRGCYCAGLLEAKAMYQPHLNLTGTLMSLNQRHFGDILPEISMDLTLLYLYSQL
jgi:hypothetical protein